jgi:nucleoside-diphosphate-sugar epimerase
MSGDGGSLVPVTGDSGYIGGRLLKALATAGRPVRCLSRRPDLWFNKRKTVMYGKDQHSFRLADDSPRGNRLSP